MKKSILILTLLVFSFAFLHADVYIKQQTKTGAFMGQPAKEMIQETWLGKNKMATISDEMNMILNLDENKMYMILNKTKKYIEASLPLDMTKFMPEQMAGMMKKMMEGMSLTIQPNGQTKQVGKWNTKGYSANITMMGMEMKMTFWATTDVPFDWKSYASLYAEIYKAQFRMGEKFMEEYKKVQGFPVLTEMNMMGMDVKSTVVEITKKSPTTDVYSVPQGYSKTDKLPMKGRGM